jgi:hypothetical protein
MTGSRPSDATVARMVMRMLTERIRNGPELQAVRRRHGQMALDRFMAMFSTLYPILREYGWDPLDDVSWERAAKVAVARGLL